jgi:hypothetical protein
MLNIVPWFLAASAILQIFPYHRCYSGVRRTREVAHMADRSHDYQSAVCPTSIVFPITFLDSFVDRVTPGYRQFRGLNKAEWLSLRTRDWVRKVVVKRNCQRPDTGSLTLMAIIFSQFDLSVRATFKFAQIHFPIPPAISYPFLFFSRIRLQKVNSGFPDRVTSKYPCRNDHLRQHYIYPKASIVISNSEFSRTPCLLLIPGAC